MRALLVSNICFYREGIVRTLRDHGVDTTVLDHGLPAIADMTALVDVVLVDLVGDHLTRTLELTGVQRPIVGLAVTSDPPVAVAAALGIRAFVGCDETVLALVRTVQRAARGEAVCPASIAALLFASFHAAEPNPSIVLPEALTRREREIGRLVMRGYTNKEIASALVIEPATVKNHVHQILRKLDVRRRGQAADLLRAVWTERSNPLGPIGQTAESP
jgi:two-component system, NarL family, nitrate/nitrite response regulator NarL